MIKFMLLAVIIVSAEGLSSPIDRLAKIRSFGNSINADNSYSYFSDTTNGIAVQESGIGGVVARGTTAYISSEGQIIQFQYIADENGFHPQGAHLPTPPPTPNYITRALEYIRTHPQNFEFQI